MLLVCISSIESKAQGRMELFEKQGTAGLPVIYIHDLIAIWTVLSGINYYSIRLDSRYVAQPGLMQNQSHPKQEANCPDRRFPSWH